MRFILNAIYLLLAAAVSPYLVYSAVRYGKYRQGWAQKLLGLAPDLPATNRRLWFHAVSVGEVNLLDALFKQYDRADDEIVISTTTKTGFELATKRHPDKTVFYCPLDFSWAVRNAFGRIKPTGFVLVELELWPNLLCEAGRRDVPVAIVNGRLSDRSARGYGRLGPLIRGWMQNVSVVAAQSKQCSERFERIGVPSDRVHTVGSMKFDGAKTDRNNPKTRELAKLFGITLEDVVFVAGSTQSPEETLALNVFHSLAKNYPQLKLVLVPRHPERANEVASILDRCGASWVRRSEIHDHPTKDIASEPRILLVDVVGELGGWWGTANLGFVGGSMGKRGGQNMIEPSAYGVATCFGPNTKNFRSIVELLLQADAARVVPDEESLRDFVVWCLDDADFAVELGTRAQALVLEHRGAAAETARLLQRVFRPSVAFKQSNEPLPESASTAIRRGA